MTTKKLTKLLALYLPYILLGLVATNFGEVLRCRDAVGGLPEKQKCKEVQARHGVRLCPVECIILSVKNSTWTHRRICT